MPSPDKPWPGPVAAFEVAIDTLVLDGVQVSAPAALAGALEREFERLLGAGSGAAAPPDSDLEALAPRIARAVWRGLTE